MSESVTTIPSTVDVPADQRPLAEPTSDALREFLSDAALGEGMLSSYVRDVFPRHLARFEIRAVEVEWTRELLPSLPRAGSRKAFPIGLDAAGRCDIVAFDRDARALIIADHKTSASGHVLADGLLRIDPQAKTYLWGMPTFDGVPVRAFMHNTLVKSVPHAPKLLKARKKSDPHGGLSKDKAQNTTLALYRAAIAEHGLAESDYAEIIDHLARNPRQYFAESLIVHDAATLAEHEAEMRWIAIERAESPAYRSPNKILCPGCPFFMGLCESDTPDGRANFRVLDEAHVELDEVRPAHGERPIITTSEIGEWTRCHRRHALHYGAGLVPLVDARALRFGTGVHYVLADLYRGAMNGRANPAGALGVWDAWCETEARRIYGIGVNEARHVVESEGGNAAAIDNELPF